LYREHYHSSTNRCGRVRLRVRCPAPSFSAQRPADVPGQRDRSIGRGVKSIVKVCAWFTPESSDGCRLTVPRAIDDEMALKIEQQSLPSKTEPTDDELATPLPDHETVTCNSERLPTTIDEQRTSIKVCNDADCGVSRPYNTKDNEVTSSQYLTAQSTITTISESNHPLLLLLGFNMF